MAKILRSPKTGQFMGSVGAGIVAPTPAIRRSPNPPKNNIHNFNLDPDAYKTMLPLKGIPRNVTQYGSALYDLIVLHGYIEDEPTRRRDFVQKIFLRTDTITIKTDSHVEIELVRLEDTKDTYKARTDRVPQQKRDISMIRSTELLNKTVAEKRLSALKNRTTL